MEPPEPRTHSFVVKVWEEEPAAGAPRPVWRGHVTHVPSGVRRYFRGLHEIVLFIRPYLLGVGGRVGPRRRLLDCLDCIRLCARWRA